MKIPRRSWMTFSVGLLVIGILLAGYVVYRILTRPSSTDQGNTNLENTNGIVAPTCGNGRCENVACLATNCPEPETATSCPEDCSDLPDDTAENANATPGNANTNAGSAGVLNFSAAPQSLADKNSCPVEEANMTPSDAVGIAAAAGLAQGQRAVEVKLLLADPPLEQCVWSIKNYLADDSGRMMLVVDATQDVYRTTSWKE
ncbi:MAG: hypothetical protein HY976_00850 [Candidatus Kerfeldbacteria bacterium]|nr:hypothetical protein [Candidatus Kerfeldbacteria bacterium]